VQAAADNCGLRLFVLTLIVSFALPERYFSWTHVLLVLSVFCLESFLIPFRLHDFQFFLCISSWLILCFSGSPASDSKPQAIEVPPPSNADRAREYDAAVLILILLKQRSLAHGRASGLLVSNCHKVACFHPMSSALMLRTLLIERNYKLPMRTVFRGSPGGVPLLPILMSLLIQAALTISLDGPHLKLSSRNTLSIDAYFERRTKYSAFPIHID
jgi:hypothetical protein